MSDCILCGARAVQEVLDLGSTSLANKFVGPEQLEAAETRYPLRLGRCGACGHIQLIDIVPPEAMFDTYLYISSLSPTLVKHLRSVARTAAAFVGAKTDDLVVDIGSNDGTLLTGYPNSLRRMGVDPARNLADLAAEKGIETTVDYFGETTASRLLNDHGVAKVITATNSFPHIPQLDDYIRGVKTLLAPDGVFLIEAHYGGAMVEETAFDTIYHEHASYWLLNPMRQIFARHGLEMSAVEILPIHHGQARVFVSHKGARQPDSSVGQFLAEERARGLLTNELWGAFADRVRTLKSELTATLQDMHAQGLKIGGYGAPAKASTLLDYLNLGPSLITRIYDKSPLKQGLFTPGSHIPIAAPEDIDTDAPDVLVLFAWNFAEEILDQLSSFRKRGGRFIIPVPEVRVVT